MRYSRILFVLALTFVLVFASSFTSFATYKPDITVSVSPDPSGTATGEVDRYWDAHIDAVNSADGKFIFSKWQVWYKFDPPGYNNSYWDWKDTSLPQSAVFKIYDDISLRAVFAEKFMFTVNVFDSGMGSFTGSSPGYYLPGESMAVTPTPVEGYRLDYWELNGTSYDASSPIAFPMPGMDATLNLYFEENPSFEITTFVEDEEDWGTVTGAGVYKIGSPVTLTAVPARGYAFSYWEVDWNLEEPSGISSLSDSAPLFDSSSPTITFPMQECDGAFTAYFTELETAGVLLIADPEGKGSPQLVNPAFPGDDDFDGYYYVGEYYNVMPNPILHWHFVGYDWECMSRPDAQYSVAAKIESPYMTTDPEYDFNNHGCNTQITVYYEEDYYVMATVKYLDANDVPIKPETQEKLYLGAYIFAPPAIAGYTFGVSTPNAAGTVTDATEPFTVIHKYYVPQVVTNTNTVTVTETVFVNVPATTAAPTEAITEEVVPLGVATITNFDEIYMGEETVEAPVIVEEEETPLADALPQTGQLPVELFYGVGGLVSTLGIYIRRRK